MARIRGGTSTNGNNTHNINLRDRVTDRGGDDDTFHFNAIDPELNPNTGKGHTSITGFSADDQINLTDLDVAGVSIQDFGGRNPRQVITVDMTDGPDIHIKVVGQPVELSDILWIV